MIVLLVANLLVLSGPSNTLFHLHVPKTGGTFIHTWLTSRALSIETEPPLSLCFPKYSRVCCGVTANLDTTMIAMAKSYCNLASDEWSFKILSSRKVRPDQIITTVRRPLMHIKSQIEHDMRHKRYSSPDEKLFGSVRIGYPYENPQSKRLLPSTNMTYPEIRAHLAQFLAVGIIDYPLHTACLFMHRMNATRFESCFCGNALFSKKRNANNRLVTNYSTKTLDAIYQNTKVDELIYAAAFSVFVESLREVEEKRNISLLSCL